MLVGRFSATIIYVASSYLCLWSAYTYVNHSGEHLLKFCLKNWISVLIPNTSSVSWSSYWIDVDVEHLSTTHLVVLNFIYHIDGQWDNRSRSWSDIESCGDLIFRGSSTVPWRTPGITGAGLDDTPSTTTDWVRSVSHDWINFHTKSSQHWN